jgi:WD40 repeat protein
MYVTLHIPASLAAIAKQAGNCAEAKSALPCQVYAIAFNNPFGDKVATGSFDKTAKIWDAGTGKCCCTLRGK